MRINPDHWLARTRRLPSPNYDDRCDPFEICLIVVHGISLPPGEFGNGMIDRLFLNELDTKATAALADLEGLEVSSHLLIDRRGRCTQYVAFDRRAWHAGASSWRGRPACNDFAIGIELEGTDSRPYTAAQYRRLVLVTNALIHAYPRLAPDAVVGHFEIAPHRKTDPGSSFDWSRYLLGLNRPEVA
ncbi:MAG: 1,6-anhydro-N-acetylmuramyl-L-alanine amidase AmpD [Gammaproteobacteria bacterium]|nr:1,6-anhydro-N-acetylmuramyl-L-alanine amidase AmpD [Gammaproteobacteria bacterium]